MADDLLSALRNLANRWAMKARDFNRDAKTETDEVKACYHTGYAEGYYRAATELAALLKEQGDKPISATPAAPVAVPKAAAAVSAPAAPTYATITVGDLEIAGLPQAARKKLPRYPVPVLRLARLAVDQRAQGQGIGKLLLRCVFDLASKMSHEYGCIGVVVDAKDSAVSFYEALGFFELEVLEGHQQTRPQPKAMFLPLKEIEAARKAKKPPAAAAR